MIERELIVEQFWSIVASVPGVKRTARNPVNPPNADDLPCINFFEMGDEVISSTVRGRTRFPAYQRELTIVMEVFIQAEDDHAASGELVGFVLEVKKKLYANGTSLGLKDVELTEAEAGRILRPPNVENVAGVGLVLKLKYIEDTSKLFA